MKKSNDKQLSSKIVGKLLREKELEQVTGGNGVTGFARWTGFSKIFDPNDPK